MEKKMKKTIKKLLPEKIKNFIIDYRNNQLISNYFKKKHQKYALLSYILTPFKKDSLSHTNFFEAQSWAKILDELIDKIGCTRADVVKQLALIKLTEMGYFNKKK